ncbi:MAG: molybdopterin cofactor-binding domain-containing protein, partial [Chloroflexota bacterium]|nr:molybdopterin cofactor-binding domain-containing protein [Chloroflexota bacterium]
AEDVHPSVADTDSIGYTAMTGGSRTTFATGWAAYETAQDIKKKMIGRAASIWDVSEEDIELSEGVFQHKDDPELKLTFKELAGQLAGSGGGISSQTTVDPSGAGGAFGTHVVDLEIDPDTGKVTILDYTIVQDAGKAVHPSYVEGQMQGGVVQGIGWALNEEYTFDGDGRMANSSFLDYRMPTSLDLPMINTIIVEVANPGHPYGVRGVGEVPIVPPMAAIANAIARAIGIRMEHLPMSPGAILEAMWAKDGEPAGLQAAD